MLPPECGTLLPSRFRHPGTPKPVPMYRTAAPASAPWNLAKTMVMVSLWTVAVVWALPRTIASLERDGDFDIPGFQELPTVGAAVLAAGTLLVVWAAVTMAWQGRGTPLTFDAPRRLVVSGPYAWMRNPMVVGSLVQGLGLGALYGSLPIIGLFAAGALVWHLARRCDDEDELQRVFGREFELYRRSVRCWLPLRKRWSRPPGTGPIAYNELNSGGRRRIKTRR
jgi:protein-S-isoprenylcysteine O-methyltransferase Ste14